MSDKTCSDERKKWLLANRVPEFVQNLKKFEQIEVDINQAFLVLCQADPSSNKSAVQWIVNAYTRKSFLYEDIRLGNQSKINRILSDFNLFKNKLDTSKRSLYAYNTIAEIYESVEPFVLESDLNKTENNSENINLKTDKKLKAISDSYFLHSSDSLKIVIPLTKQAAQWWGQGTQWCTSSTYSDNYFDDYNQQAPLLILLFNEQENENNNEKSKKTNKGKFRKLQAWINYKTQFMDERDSPVSVKIIENNWNCLYPFILWMVKQDYGTLRLIPKNKLTQEICNLALDSLKDNDPDHNYDNDFVIDLIPTQFRSKQFWIKAVEKSQISLGRVPEDQVDLNLCLLAINTSVHNLAYVPDNLMNKEIFTNAIKQDPSALKYVKETFVNEDLYQLAVDTNASSFQFIPDLNKTKKICQQALKSNALMFQYLPKKMQNEQIAWMAIKANSNQIRFVCEKNLTKEMCMYAVEQKPTNLKFVPNELRDQLVCEQAVKKAGYCLRWVPEQLRSKKLCLLAAAAQETNKSDNRLSIKLTDIPKHILDNELCLAAISACSSNIALIPKNLITEEICLIGLKNNAVNFYLIPKDLLTEEICLLMVKQDGGYITEIPARFRTEEVCLTAIKNYLLAIKHIPSSLITDEFISKVVRLNPMCIEYINDIYITKEIALIAATNGIRCYGEINNKYNKKQFDYEIDKYNRIFNLKIGYKKEIEKIQWNLDHIIQDWNSFKNNQCITQYSGDQINDQNDCFKI